MRAAWIAGWTPWRAGTIAFGVMLLVIETALNVLLPHGWLAWHRLAAEGRTVPAIIVAVRPQAHAGCSFDYVVAGLRRHGSDSGCADRAIGTSVEATYLPSDPDFAVLRDPASEANTMAVAPVFLALFAGLAFASSVRRLRMRLAQSPSMDKPG